MDFISNAMVSLSQRTDTYKNINQIVRSHGYPFEKHFYETKDGYINTVIRIAGGKGSDMQIRSDDDQVRKPVVILQHGLNCSSTDWIMNSHNSLAFILADSGYDVWINNTRGNRYSRNHTTLDPDYDKAKYWDFSFEDMARFDQPALFDFVLGRTGVKKVSYIGHSQGTTQMFCALSENMDFFKERMNLFVAYAPVVKVDGVTSSIIKMVKNNQKVDKFMKKYGMYELTPLKKNNKSVAYMHKLFPGVSNFGVKLLSDENPAECDRKSLESFLAHYPSGTSLKSILHFKQMMNNGIFEHYDYGSEENLKRYGSEAPPEIPLQNIQDFPIALFAGIEDKLANIDNVRWLKDELTRQGSCIQYEEHKIGHLAFLIPRELKVYQSTLNLLKAFNPVYRQVSETGRKFTSPTENIVIEDEIQAQLDLTQKNDNSVV
eukprot:403367625